MWEAGGKLFLREWKLFSPMTRRKKKKRENAMEPTNNKFGH
jgi:hypothetical protein